jgi:class I fructose-bisphosphate aldolase
VLIPTGTPEPAGPGSAARNHMYESLGRLAVDAGEAGLPLVVWSYPRGSGVCQEGRTAVDVVACGAHLACQMGAHLVKVKPHGTHPERRGADGAGAGGRPAAHVGGRIRNVVQ